MGGGISSSDIAPRSPSEEKKTLKNWYNFQQNQLGNFVAGQPLLATANKGALDFWGGLSKLISPIQDFQGRVPDFFSGLQSDLGGFQSELGGLKSELTKDQSGLSALSGRIGSYLPALNNLARNQKNIYDTLKPVLFSHGKLTPQMERDVAQSTRAIAAAQGNAHTNAALGTELLNRDSAREARFNQYLQNALGLSSSIGGLTQLRSGLTGEQAGILGQKAGITGQKAGITGQQAGITGMQSGLFGQEAGLTTMLPSAIQGLQTGGLNQLLGTEGANVSSFGAVTNPILSYLGNLYQGNLQARIAQAQLDTQASAQNASKSAGAAGGGLSAIGSIIGAIGPALAMSDERLKAKIKKTGISKDGVEYHTFEYKTKPGVVFLGPMAQDVQKKSPASVVEDPVSGAKFIDTSRYPVFQLISATGEKRKAA